MRDKAYCIVISILATIALVLVGITFIVFSKTRQVDCDRYANNGTDYKPMPKQCKKGE